MDLRNDIKKATLLNCVEDDIKFYRLHGLSQAAKDKKMNERKVKKPRNLHILEDSENESECDENTDVINSRVKSTFDKYEVSAAIREVNGGRDLSNKHWEESFLRKLEDMAKAEKEIPHNYSSKHDNIQVNQSEDKKLKDKYIKHKNRLSRNAAIMGLIKTKQITFQDLITFNEKEKNELESLTGTVFNEHITDDDKCQVESVPLREDPEVFVHPLQMGIDTKKFQNIDFTLKRIGKKTKVTPAQYFRDATDDTFFEFVKKEKRDSTT